MYDEGEGITLAEYQETWLARTYLRFHYLQISLPRLSAMEYVAAASPLGAGLAVLMQMSHKRAEQVALHVEALRRIRQAQEAETIDEARAFLLVKLIATYLPLRDEERERVQRELEQQGDHTMEATELTWADRILAEGIQQGRLESLRDAVRQAALERFGTVPPQLEAAVIAATREDELRALLKHVWTADSIND